MNQPLESEYLDQCERDARRFSGAFTGTSGTLAAHVIRLLKERQRLVVRLAMLEERPAANCGNDGCNRC